MFIALDGVKKNKGGACFIMGNVKKNLTALTEQKFIKCFFKLFDKNLSQYDKKISLAGLGIG